MVFQHIGRGASYVKNTVFGDNVLGTAAIGVGTYLGTNYVIGDLLGQITPWLNEGIDAVVAPALTYGVVKLRNHRQERTQPGTLATILRDGLEVGTAGLMGMAAAAEIQDIVTEQDVVDQGLDPTDPDVYVSTLEPLRVFFENYVYKVIDFFPPSTNNMPAGTGLRAIYASAIERIVHGFLTHQRQTNP